jgi:hypothetical protein
MNDEQHLEALPSDQRSPTPFVNAIEEFERSFRLTTRVFQPGETPPALAGDPRLEFK